MVSMHVPARIAKGSDNAKMRERIATAAMQGLLYGGIALARGTTEYAEHAVALADALMAELDK